ncbi:hypothetical protein [Singulisphaera sp. PoT]|uniref:hypothetical protein n=1 Tax=Singulisphaera sp. PoT TaxID=3411797 RepID=UPI003BF600E4
MRRQLTILALTGVIGSLVLSSDASACHKKKCAAPAPACVVAAPAPCYVPAPAPVCAPAPVACAPAPKKCGFGGFKMPKFKLGCHKKQAVVCAAPVYAAPVCETVAPSAQVLPSGQGY